VDVHSVFEERGQTGEWRIDSVVDKKAGVTGSCAEVVGVSGFCGGADWSAALGVGLSLHIFHVTHVSLACTYATIKKYEVLQGYMI
jgi:hypothetical protein